MGRKTVSILGATGSIGDSTVDVVLSAPECFEVCTLTAHENAEKLAGIARKTNAKRVIIGNTSKEGVLKDALAGTGVEVLSGDKALSNSVLPGTDVTVSAITGMAGLAPLMNAIENSSAVAIANKEPLVAAGPQVMKAAQKHDTTILPIDSEHNAVFQVFDFEQKAAIERIILTASGGPFRTWDKNQIAKATVEQALAHPTWDMGRKISIDSASMVNKALEVMEAHVLFDLPPEQIDVLIHPQSIVHSMVEYADGSVLSQMGASDMRTPITYALSWPARMKTPGERLDVKALSSLSFEEPDLKKFPALGLAYDCLKNGQGACLTFNAANEIAVDAFLNKRIDFLGIINVIEYALDNIPDMQLDTVGDIVNADQAVRLISQDYIDKNASQVISKAI